MSESDRGLSFAVGVIVCLVVVWALGAGAGAYYQAERDKYQQSEAKPYGGPLKPDEFWGTHAASPETYQAICDSPKDEGQADLCQQWRSANYAEQGLNYTVISLLFGLAGLAGVGYTVIYSIRATDAATGATKAAIESNKIARDIAAKELRAYIQVSSAGIEWLEVGKRPMVYCLVKNYGNTPALKLSVHTLVSSGFGDPSTKKMVFDKETAKGPAATIDLGSGGEMRQESRFEKPVPQAVFDKFKSGEMCIVYAGILRYRDIFGVRRRTIFRYELAPDLVGEGSTTVMRLAAKHNRAS